ncbi:hypothetical protein GA0061070_10791 [Kosakonia oryziphila]|uniref:OmpR/PhoB-type domain-containing protein n=1 Tax=Kosakonia oryziphila TaxID=1005667 RepID=A0A1C4GKR6_9ENTR|nr:hypothetical protein GA0061070_10791 [Kosakonia oryziphila]
MSVSNNTIYQNISILRKTLVNVGLSGDLIKTVPKRGFMILSESFADFVSNSGTENNSSVTSDNKNRARRLLSKTVTPLGSFISISIILCSLSFFVAFHLTVYKKTNNLKYIYPDFYELHQYGDCHLYRNKSVRDNFFLKILLWIMGSNVASKNGGIFLTILPHHELLYCVVHLIYFPLKKMEALFASQIITIKVIIMSKVSRLKAVICISLMIASCFMGYLYAMSDRTKDGFFCTSDGSFHTQNKTLSAVINFHMQDGEGFMTLEGKYFENDNKVSNVSLQRQFSYTEKNGEYLLTQDGNDVLEVSEGDKNILKQFIADFYFTKNTGAHHTRIKKLRNNLWIFTPAPVPYFVCADY